MLQNIFRRGREVAEGIRYGMSAVDAKGTVRAVAPLVVYGDEEEVIAVVRGSRWSRRYVAGVLAFAEPDLPEYLKRQIIREHLAVLFPGLDPARIAALYVQHRDKGNLELHFWIACSDLETGKRINPYYHKVDCGRCRLWVQSVNDRHQLKDPNDPAHWQLRPPPARGAGTHQNIKERLVAALEKLALSGAVRSRAEIEQALLTAGWKISRRSKRFLSVVHERIKNPIRLAGRMFSQDWNGDGQDIQQLSRAFQRARTKRLRETLVALVPLLRLRADYNQRRYGGDSSTEPFVNELIDAAEQALATEAAPTPGAAQPSFSQTPGPSRRRQRWTQPLKPSSTTSDATSETSVLSLRPR